MSPRGETKGKGQIVHKRFFWKNLVSLMAISLIPVILLGAFAIIIANTYVRRDVRAVNEVMLGQAREMVEYVFGELDSINIVFTASPSIMDNARSILGHEGGISFEEVQMLRILQNFLDGPVNSRAYFHSIYIYFDDSPNRFLSSGIGIVDTETFTDIHWIDSYLNKPAGIEGWTQIRSIHNNVTDTVHDNIISIYRRIHFPGRRTPEGVIVLNIRADYINNLLDNFRSRPDNILLVYDEDGNVLFYSSGDAQSMVSYSESGPYEVIRLFSQRYSWEFVSVTPTASLYVMAFGITTATVAILAVLSILAIIIAFRMNRHIYSGLYRLMEIFDAAQNQRPIPFVSAAKSNEYLYIAQNIVKTFVEHDYLKMQLSERKYRLQAMELNALRAQIHPHFLFNVLETLYWKVFSLTKDKNDANVIIEHLSDVLKYSLYGKSDTVSLKDEIKYTESYLAIQRLRFKLAVEWEYDEKDWEIIVPKLILQPIIENSIHHGICEAKNKICIKICIYAEGDKMSILITDDGAGISPQNLTQLRNRLEQSDDIVPSDHIGLLNTHKRLVLMHGDGCGIKINSEEGKGASVHLTLLRKLQEQRS